MLATNAGLLTPVLGDPSPWTPQRLYLNNEAGLYYEPADLTAEKVAWRRNLLTWTEQFDNAAWAKADATVTANAGVAPDGTTTADKLVENTAANVIHRVQAAVALGGSVDAAPYVFSIYAKADGRSIIRIYDNNQNTSGVSFFDLSTGTVASGTGSIVSVGSGWYRCSVFPLRNFSTSAVPRVELVQSGTTVQYTGDGTSGVLLWGAQLEVGTTASAYQRITDFTSDFLAAFPTHALYQDAAGTTPVTALGQPVGLALDKSRGALANLGATVLTNGDFASGTGWTAGTGWSIGSGVATKTAGTASVLSQAVTLAIPGTYRLVYTMTRSAGTLTPRITGGTTVNATARSASGTYTEYVTTVTGNTTFEFSADASFAGTVDDVTVRLVPGTHAIQATSASRPWLDGRVNRLERTEQFDDAYWTKTGGATITANTAVAPDGTTTADTLTAPTGGVNRGARRVGATLVANTAFVRWVYAKRSTSDWIYLVSYDVGAGIGAWFNVNTGQVGTVQAGVTASIEAAPNGYYRCIVSWSVGSSVAFNEMDIMLTNADNTTTSSTGNAVFIWGADLRLAADAAYPYQRVVTATDYADVGVPRSFLFDGLDDSLYTASTLDLSGTDKVTVWAGVYKNSDAAAGIVAELTTTSSSTNGSFGLLAPSSPTSIRYDFRSRGTAIAIADTSAAAYTAPVANVLTGQGDIAGDLVALRANGVQVDTDSTDQGTGNYANAVLFIGRRNNASLPLNGKLYIPVVRGAQTDAATLALTDRYVGSLMGIVL